LHCPCFYIVFSLSMMSSVYTKLCCSVYTP
jgi:hypothetical protein